MHTYYVSGLPYSDELYHHGTKGMHWGVRLYQNPDGTLTPLGKIHYRLSDTSRRVKEKVAPITKKAKDHAIQKIKNKHMWLMDDAELAEATRRATNEKNYKETLRAIKGVNRGKKVASDILENGGKTIARVGFEKLANNIFNREDRSLPSYFLKEEFIKDWKTMSAEDIKKAAEKIENVRKIENSNSGGGKKKKG